MIFSFGNRKQVSHKDTKPSSVALSPQANYTDWATALIKIQQFQISKDFEGYLTSLTQRNETGNLIFCAQQYFTRFVCEPFDVTQCRHYINSPVH
jgi:hypothetical protein